MMTREEVKHILRMLVAAYPNFRPSNMSDTVDAWRFLLNEYDRDKVEAAIKKYILIDRSGFAPSIGQIVGAMQDTAEKNDMSELAAWQLVSSAISRSGYYAEEEFAKLPPVIQMAVGGAANLKEWALMDIDSVQSVVQSHFLRSYRAAEKRMAEEARLPAKFLEQLRQRQQAPPRLSAQKYIAQAEGDTRQAQEDMGQSHEPPQEVQEKLDGLKRRWGAPEGV